MNLTHLAARLKGNSPAARATAVSIITASPLTMATIAQQAGYARASAVSHALDGHGPQQRIVELLAVAWASLTDAQRAEIDRPQNEWRLDQLIGHHSPAVRSQARALLALLEDAE